MKFKVEQRFAYGWEEAPWEDNLFGSVLDAQAEIDTLVRDTADAVKSGFMSDALCAGEFRIVPARHRDTRRKREEPEY